MAELSKIAWTDHTFNPWVGCQHWSKGCDHCYADAWAARVGRDVFGGRSKRERTADANWRKPLTWNRVAQEAGRPAKVFCASLADVFEDAPGPNEWRADVFDLIRETPWLDWQLLTKRPENIAAMLPADWGRGWPNVWLGTSIEDRTVVERARVLGEIPAFCRFVSYEPALGPLLPEEISVKTWLPPEEATTYRWLDDYTGPGLPFWNSDGDHTFHWLIAGGESGPSFRPMDLAWVHDLRRQCETEEVAFFFKQIADRQPEQGADALGEVVREFPASYDREALPPPPMAGQMALEG